MTSQPPIRVRLRSIADVVQAVPYLLGFHPANSLVVVSTRGKRRRVGLTARVDLPAAALADACARSLVESIRRNGADEALVVLYPPSGDRAHPALRPLERAFQRELNEAGILLGDVVCVSDQRWWSLHCADPRCCPPEGTALEPPVDSGMALATVLSGRVVLGSREELERSIEPAGGLVGTAMAHALERESGCRPDSATAALDRFREVVNGRVHGGARPADALGVDEAAQLIVALNDVGVRDEILGWWRGEWGDATRSLLVELSRRAVEPYEAPVLTALAWIAYLQGDGGLAGIALDRVFRNRPDYRLACILDTVLRSGVDPAVYRSALESRIRAVS